MTYTNNAIEVLYEFLMTLFTTKYLGIDGGFWP